MPTNMELAICNRELVIADTKSDIFFQTRYNMTRDEFASLPQHEQLKLMGYRTPNKYQGVFTEAEDKAKRASRHAEDNIVSTWGKWFKATYPNIPYTIDKVAQSRSKLGGVIHKGAQYRKGNPDIFIQSPQAGFAGCYIEQKKNEEIFYKGTRILKPGNDNQHIWQSLYHADLRKQGYWVMFSISLESTKKITERYMAGNPYPIQIFEYYCKPEDYGMFEFHPDFKPYTPPLNKM